ncbi:hypothetical protein [Iodobacter sp.]|uniref:hypothetical protein n=1 Tax=Iodobacter sp. TaxID=1915058 RepID=UPI0025E52898|nr:hypothetical protein [Iodobacter sp.]
MQSFFYKAIILFCLAALSGCTLLGAVIGKQLDDHRENPIYENKLAAEGFNVDVELIKGIVNSPKKAEPWEEKSLCEINIEKRVCSAKSGECWCEAVNIPILP